MIEQLSILNEILENNRESIQALQYIHDVLPILIIPESKPTLNNSEFPQQKLCQIKTKQQFSPITINSKDNENDISSLSISFDTNSEYSSQNSFYKFDQKYEQFDKQLLSQDLKKKFQKQRKQEQKQTISIDD